jgi:hypothetical protein
VARLALALEDEGQIAEGTVMLALDDRTSQAVFRSRRESVLLYRLVPQTLVVFSASARVGGMTQASDRRLIWRFGEMRTFPTPVVSDKEVGAPGVRRMLQLTPERLADIVSEGARPATTPGGSDSAAPFTGISTYEAIYEEVLRRWNYRCAITGQQFSPSRRPHPDLSLVAIRPRELGGPLHVDNYLPMVALAAEAWRAGAIGVGEKGELLAVLDRLSPDLLEQMPLNGRLVVSSDPARQPAAEHLAFHRLNIFGR